MTLSVTCPHMNLLRLQSPSRSMGCTVLSVHAGFAEESVILVHTAPADPVVHTAASMSLWRVEIILLMPSATDCDII